VESAPLNQPSHPDAGAVPDRERMVAIDVLRGFALLGILLMNIQSFSMIGAAYVNPMAYGDMTGANYCVWLLCHIFADQKFMSIFSMLFGAGIVLMTGRQDASQGRSAAVHYRRMGVLLLFGLIHAYLIWYGDILVAYALCGMVAYLFRRLPPWALIVLGVLVIAVHSAIYFGISESVPYWPPGEIEKFRRDLKPEPADIAKELATVRGNWLGQLPHRAKESLFLETLIFAMWTAWRAGGLMLVGMALFKLGAFSAKWSARSYWLMLVVGMVVGVPVIVYGNNTIADHDWDPIYLMFTGYEFNYWGSLFVSLGYVGAVMLVCQHAGMSWLSRPLAAVGQMALTNYLMQSLICTTIFYGHGFGLFGHVERVGQLGIVFAVWAFQLIVSPIWLRYFQYGPAEWLWRALTYGKIPSLIRSES
jgi:uncharacterized protein